MLHMGTPTDRTQTGKVANPSHLLGLQACAFDPQLMQGWGTTPGLHAI